MPETILIDVTPRSAAQNTRLLELVAAIEAALQRRERAEQRERDEWVEVGRSARQQEPGVAVVRQCDIEEKFAFAVKAVIALLPRANQEDRRRLLEDFATRWPSPSRRLREAFFRREMERRRDLLHHLSSVQRVVLMRQSARDFADRQAWTPQDAQRDPYGLLAEGLSLFGLYEKLARVGGDPDGLIPPPPPPMPAAGAPRLPDTEVLFVVLPAVAGALTAKITDLAVDWLRRRRTTARRRRWVEILGPDGQVLRTIEVRDDEPDT
jgi:hypothetical protein